LQTNTRLVSVCYILLAAVSVVAIDLRIVLIPAACASLALAAAGIFVFRRMSGALAIPWAAMASDVEPQGFVVIEGTPLPFQGYDQELIVMVRVRHLLELLACVVLSGITLYVMIFVPIIGTSSAALQVGAYEAEFICGVGLAVLLVSLRWFVERRVLGRSHYTIGTLLGRDPGFFRRGITYQFWDNNGERRGGRGPLWGRGDDNAVLVLYDPNDPDANTAHGAFLFHRFNLALISGRHRRGATTINS
jgi:hypothetical protein